MKENKIQSECVRWFKNDHLDAMQEEGLYTIEECTFIRALFHSNNNELPIFKGVPMPKNIRNILDGWARTVKAMGLTAGVADTSLKIPMYIEGKYYPYVEIEFKDIKGKQSPRQIKYQSAVEYFGGYYKVIRSLDEFKQFINDTTTRLPKGAD